MNFFFSKKSNRFLLYLWCMLDLLFTKCGITFFKEFLLFNIKKELFYIDGACQHSGVCCRGLGIKFKGHFITTERDYKKAVQQDTKLLRFNPVFNDKKIHHFTCSCLTEDNMCSDYDNRPAICKQYPFSVFFC